MKIKMRAWLKKEKIMCDVLEWYHNGRIGISISDSGPFIKEPEDVELMLSTGLLDSRGVEIYEGDILRSETTDWLYPVTWWDLKAMFRAIKGNYLLDPAKAWKNCEIIGNIYENQELLEVE